MDTRQQKVMELRNAGWVWSAIGNYFSISKARAHQIGSGYNNEKIKKYQKEILERDNYTCQWKFYCRGSHEDLIIHHIDFNDRNNDSKNLITFCKPCHRYFHSKFHIDRDKEMMLQNHHHTTTKLFKKKCLGCGKERELVKSSLHKDFCNKNCKKKYQDIKWTMICAKCGKKFIRQIGSRWNYYRDHSKFERKAYCSRECFNST